MEHQVIDHVNFRLMGGHAIRCFDIKATEYLKES